MELDRYGLFQEDRKGPMWRGFFNDLDEAKAEAQKLADQERLVFFVYCFRKFTDVAWFHPTERRRKKRRPTVT